MTHFDDQSLCTYGDTWSEKERLAEGTLAVGWLEPEHPFTTGHVPAEFIQALHELCRQPVRRTRGIHACRLCPPPHRTWPGMSVAHPEGDYRVGNGEVHVTGRDGASYAAPSLVIHYVTEHGYRPPDGFIAAVLLAAI